MIEHVIQANCQATQVTFAIIKIFTLDFQTLFQPQNIVEGGGRNNPNVTHSTSYQPTYGLWTPMVSVNYYLIVELNNGLSF